MKKEKCSENRDSLKQKLCDVYVAALLFKPAKEPSILLPNLFLNLMSDWIMIFKILQIVKVELLCTGQLIEAI